MLALTLREGSWLIQVHGPHVPAGHRHVHIRRKRLSGEYSWNADGTRHDEHRFPPNSEAIERAKRLAANHLGVPPAMLSLLTGFRASELVVIEIDGDGPPHATVAIDVRVVESRGTPWLFVLSDRAGRLYVVLLEDRPLTG
jgi:hypothetical protein